MGQTVAFLYVGTTGRWRCKKPGSKSEKGLVKQSEATSAKQQRNALKSRSQDEQIVVEQSAQRHSGVAKQ